MKALLSERPGEPESLRLAEVADPVPGEHDVVISVHAAAANFSDALTVAGTYQIAPPRPFSPGSEAAGVVRAVGDGVHDLAIGQRVLGWAVHGAFAEQMRVPRQDVVEIPDDLPFVEASALVMTYGTAYHALVDRAGVQPGDHVLVLGAASGVGTAAVEVSRALGARITAAVSSQAKADLAHACGADHVVIYGPVAGAAWARDLGGRLKEATDGGPDIVVDILGGPFTDVGLRSLRWGGRHLVVGFPAGIPTPALNLTLLKGTSIVGVWLGGEFAARPASKDRIVDALFALRAQGHLHPRVTRTFPLSEGAAAIRSLVDRTALGKVVVAVRGG